jgi:hypothetical protein
MFYVPIEIKTFIDKKQDLVRSGSPPCNEMRASPPLGPMPKNENDISTNIFKSKTITN